MCYGVIQGPEWGRNALTSSSICLALIGSCFSLDHADADPIGPINHDPGSLATNRALDLPFHGLLKPAFEILLRAPAELALLLGRVDRVAAVMARPMRPTSSRTGPTVDGGLAMVTDSHLVDSRKRRGCYRSLYLRCTVHFGPASDCPRPGWHKNLQMDQACPYSRHRAVRITGSSPSSWTGGGPERDRDLAQQCGSSSISRSDRNISSGHSTISLSMTVFGSRPATRSRR